MIHPTIKVLEQEILKNQPGFTRLICNIFTIDEGVAILNAVRKNKYLTSCSIFIQPNAMDYKILKLIERGIVFKTEENALFTEEAAKKFTFFKAETESRSDDCIVKSLSPQGETE